MMKPKGDLRSLHAMIGVALLILFVAGGNFVNMMTARAARRAVEVGVRKSVGATDARSSASFMGECLFYVGLALVVAIVAVTLLLPGFNGFLGRTIRFDYLQDPLLAFGIVFVTVITGVAAVSIRPWWCRAFARVLCSRERRFFWAIRDAYVKPS